MRRTPPGATTVLVGLVLALVLAVGGWVVSRRAASPDDPGAATPFPAPPTGGWGPPSQTPPPDTPQPGRDYPVRDLGVLAARSTTVTGSGSADLHYRRLTGSGTAVHFTCTGCDGQTWLVETSRPWPLSGGPLPYPEDYSYVLDTVDVQAANGLLVKAPPKARWRIVLTPFDALPVASGPVSGRRSAVVRVRTSGESTLGCDGPVFAKTFYRETGMDEYEVGTVLQEDAAATSKLFAPHGTDLMVAVLVCADRWTLTPG